MTCETTQVCTVHRNSDKCASSQLSRLEIAIAFALIRLKPANQNLREFVTNLQSFYRDKVSLFSLTFFLS